MEEPPDFAGKPGEPVPQVDPDDLKAVFEFVREAAKVGSFASTWRAQTSRRCLSPRLFFSGCEAITAGLPSLHRGNFDREEDSL
jgi:hypothetical protein